MNQEAPQQTGVAILTVSEARHQFNDLPKHFDARPVRFFRDGVEQRDIRNVDRHFFFDDATGHIARRIGLGMPLYHIDVFDHHAVVVQHAHDGAALALVPTGGNDDVVTFPDLLHLSVFPIFYRWILLRGLPEPAKQSS